MELIDLIGRTATHRYYSYSIPKRSGKGRRAIHHPARELKMIQRWLIGAVVSGLPVHDAAAAYRTGRGIRQHAQLHAGSRFLLRLDFQKFFPSLRTKDIRQLLSQHSDLTADWDSDDLDWFCSIVCRKSRLTIGAPTSPGISNALCFDLDSALSDLAGEKGVKYSRYADDLFFSTSEPDVLRTVEVETKGIVTSLKVPASLRINEGKTIHSSKRGRRVVTGVVLSSAGELSVGRGRKRSIRTLVYRFPGLNLKEKRRLAGMLAYVRSVEPGFIDKLVLKYGSKRIEDIFSCMAQEDPNP